MDSRLQKQLSDGDIDANGNRLNENDHVTLECESVGLKYCFSFSDYKRMNNPNTSEKEDVDDDKIEVSETSRGKYNHYSESQKERFWQMVGKEGCSVYRAALLNGIKLQTAYTWKNNWNRQVIEELNGIYRTPKKRGRKPKNVDST
ncbi:hypothetical protein G210_3762 [Candida maltosa Xu316]|uniref:Uncharacterized protein n=1 Tax=Candida maltosa (strain Xu316) TaxID=1245528 RepID=M3HFI2_CANMX|nr:hypothetical protein G210_3762 [Candida maltosa Xu316]